MSVSITTNAFRQRVAKHIFDGTDLPQATHMAFGDGGHNPDLTPKAGDAAQTSLVHEIVRKTLSAKSQEDLYSMTGTGVISEPELIGAYISEAGLLDANGNLIALKNFTPKIKESDETYEIRIKMRF